MNFANVLLICTGAIAVCAGLVFEVETLVAFCFHEQDGEPVPVTPHPPGLLDQPDPARLPYARAA